MLELLAKVVALGIGSTLSPGLLAITLALLAAKSNQLRRSLAFLAGGIVVACIVILGSHLIFSALGAAKPSSLAYADFAIGGLLVLFGIFSLLVKEKEPKPGAQAGAGALKWFAISFALNITNFDAVFLLLTESREIAQSGAAFAYQLALYALGALFFTLPCWLPIAVYVAMPEKAQKTLAPLGGVMKKYGKWLAALIFFGFGAYLVSKGIGSF